MAGGMLQIVAYGAQDMYLTYNPQITYFKTVYRRYTNFSIQQFELALVELTDFGTSTKFELPKNGDLITKMYLRVILNSVTPLNGANFAWTRRIGHAIINNIEMNIGGARIDRHLGTWLDVWYELARTGRHEIGYEKLIGDVPELTDYNTAVKPMYELTIPMKFWFNNRFGLALPLIAIQYSRILFQVQLNPVNNLIIYDSVFVSQINTLSIVECSVVVDYIYLDNEERDKFATLGSEYLIEQAQYNDSLAITNYFNQYQLAFSYPCKELIWIIQNGNYISSQQFLCYTNREDWTNILLACSNNILTNSILVYLATSPLPLPPSTGDWELFETSGVSSNGNYIVTIDDPSYVVYINLSSLISGSVNLTGEISANIDVALVGSDITITISDLVSTLSVSDVSIPVSSMIDTRLSSSNDVFVNIFSNYGLLIDGSMNIVQYASLIFNDDNRVVKRTGNFFNYLQPELVHTNTPKDGINVYSFALKPEIHQPTGTANLSRIENVYLNIWVGSDYGLFNIDTQLTVFAFSYNIFKISNGLAALSYSD